MNERQEGEGAKALLACDALDPGPSRQHKRAQDTPHPNEIVVRQEVKSTNLGGTLFFGWSLWRHRPCGGSVPGVHTPRAALCPPWRRGVGDKCRGIYCRGRPGCSAFASNQGQAAQFSQMRAGSSRLAFKAGSPLAKLETPISQPIFIQKPELDVMRNAIRDLDG